MTERLATGHSHGSLATPRKLQGEARLGKLSRAGVAVWTIHKRIAEACPLHAVVGWHWEYQRSLQRRWGGRSLGLLITTKPLSPWPRSWHLGLRDGAAEMPGERACRLHILQRPNLALPIERGPVHPVQLHELPSHFERFLLRLHLDQCVAPDDLLGLSERSIRDV